MSRKCRPLGRMGSQGFCNRKKPGIPHLLSFGEAGSEQRWKNGIDKTSKVVGVAPCGPRPQDKTLLLTRSLGCIRTLTLSEHI